MSIWRWFFPDDDQSRTAAIKQLLLREAADLLVPREDQQRPRVIHPTAKNAKTSEWELHRLRVQARARRRR